MNQEQYKQSKRIFLDARLLPTEERNAFVDSNAAGDPEVAAQARSLLRFDSNPGTPTESGYLSSVQELLHELTDDGRSLIGRTINQRYRVIRSIGAGGMGTVYEAEQLSPRRRVAIKIIRSCAASPRLLARFQHEAQFLAELNHPGIAHVYEFGTFYDEGGVRPFLAMEFIDGAQSLTAYVEARSLSTPDRLALFARVCAAVHHGHQKPIIHRDLKPDNILVDSNGDPKVIDFGVARATNADLQLTTLQTSVGQLIGTLQYMSPEQCAGDPSQIDVRSDIYSLGVILYQLLCGRPPYDLSDIPLLTAAQMVQRQVPPRPSRLRKLLRGDLETIVLKALEKDRPARYQSVAEMLDDIHRYLAHKPIHSRPPGTWSRLRTWAGSHPLLFVTSAGAAILLFSLLLTFLSVYVLGVRVDRIVVDGDGNTAGLVSRARHRLHEWNRADNNSYPLFARLVDRPPQMGGGRVALIVSSRQAPNDLAAFELSRPDLPLWTTASQSLDFPPGEPSHDEHVVVPAVVQIDDYFPELPGDEILVIHRLRSFSACAIRIFDLQGVVHFHTWHDGALGGAVLLRESFLLVLAGLNSEHSWTTRGVGNPEMGSYPPVTFALRLRDGHLRPRQWIVKDGNRLDDTLAWYRWLGPTESLSSFQTVFAIPRAWRGRTVGEERLTIEFQEWENVKGVQTSTTLSISVDAQGRETSRFISEPFRSRARLGLIPDDSLLQLLEYEELPLPKPHPVAADRVQESRE